MKEIGGYAIWLKPFYFGLFQSKKKKKTNKRKKTPKLIFFSSHAFTVFDSEFTLFKDKCYLQGPDFLKQGSKTKDFYFPVFLSLFFHEIQSKIVLFAKLYYPVIVSLHV